VHRLQELPQALTRRKGGRKPCRLFDESFLTNRHKADMIRKANSAEDQELSGLTIKKSFYQRT
jgi:hypothetical protein